MPATTVCVEVTIAVEYEASQQTPEQLANNLRCNVASAVGRGLLTDGAHRTAVTHSVDVRGLSAREVDLDQSEVADWLATQIESGVIRLEDITTLMARFAFSTPAAMRQEFSERMPVEEGA